MNNWRLGPTVLFILLLYIFFNILRLIDIFALELVKKIDEIFISKSVGFIVLILVLVFTSKDLSFIGLTKHNAWKSSKYGLVSIIATILAMWIVYFGLLMINGEELSFNLEKPLTFYLVYFVIMTNVTNVFMEEGFFRGYILNVLDGKMKYLWINILQSFLFGIWHVIWEIKLYIEGSQDLGATIGNSFTYFLATFIFAFVTGHLFYTTKNLFGPLIMHLIWNSNLSILGINPPEGLGYITMLTFLVGLIVLLLSMRYFPSQQDSETTPQ